MSSDTIDNITTPEITKTLEREIKILLKKSPNLIYDKKHKIEQTYLDLADSKVLEKVKGVSPDYAGFEKTFTEARVRRKDNTFYFTMKSEGDLIREEFEMVIDKKLYLEFLELKSLGTIVKTRYVQNVDLERRYKFEFDIYEGKLEGLFILEVEYNLEVGEDEKEKHKWIEGMIRRKIVEYKEDELVNVTFDKRYKNKNLAVEGIKGPEEGESKKLKLEQ